MAAMGFDPAVEVSGIGVRTDMTGAAPAFRGGAPVSWAAIIAGAFVAVGVSLILLALGSGLGFAATSPWADRGMSGTAFGISAAIWLLLTQWLSAALGGYIAGRMRARWHGTHNHEVFFRDTAHGLITWSVATALMASLLTSSVFATLGGGVHALSGAATAGLEGASAAALSGSSNTGPAGPLGDGYAVDKLFRPAAADADAAADAQRDPRREALHIAANAASTGNLSDTDRSYLAALVAQRTGAPPAEAQKRVDDFDTAVREGEARIKAAADAARKTAAETSIYLSLSLLVGAFIACVSAALGGRLRDEHL